MNVEETGKRPGGARSEVQPSGERVGWAWPSPGPAKFHPAVRAWFERRFPAGPTEPQTEGWPAIAAREHTLIAAPTGSGKTLAAFLVCIDALIRRASPGGTLPDETRVVYVSPLKTLAAHIH